MRFIRPNKRYGTIGVATVFNTLKRAKRVGLNISDLFGHSVNTGTEFVGNDDLIYAAGAESIRELVKRYGVVVIVFFNEFPSFTVIGRFVNLKRLDVGFLIGACRDIDFKFLLVCIFGNSYLRCVAGDNDLKGFGSAEVVNALHRVRTACGKGKGFAKTEIAE